MAGTTKNKTMRRNLKNTGVLSGRWKGENAQYSSIHKWVVKWKGVPNTCEMCGESGFFGRKANWANIDHKYRRVLDDYIRLCRYCHAEYDKKLS